MDNKKQSSIQIAIDRLNALKLESRNPELSRSGDYRIGLTESICELEELKAMHKQEIYNAYEFGSVDCDVDLFRPEDYYNETFNK